MILNHIKNHPKGVNIQCDPNPNPNIKDCFL